MTTQNPTLARRSILTGAAALFGLAHAPRAFAQRAYAQSDLASLNVIDRDTGAVLPAWRHQGRLFVAGESGRRYGLRLTNRSNGRLLMVLSVDGVNALSGQTAQYDQQGFVLGPHESYDVNGWRKSDNQIAAFAFAALSQSYAARTGRPDDVGVIGMAVFREKQQEATQSVGAASPPSPPITYRRAEPSRKSALAAPADIAPPPPLALPPVQAPLARPAPPPAPVAAPSARASGASDDSYRQAGPAERLGTAHGALEQSYLSRVQFIRASSYPQSVQQIEYDSYANLLSRGVIPQRPPQPRQPRAFPGAGYVPDPPAD